MEFIFKFSEKLDLFMENQKKFIKEVKEILENEDDNLTKKLYKNLKKLEFYLEGGEELFKDVSKAIEKYIEKNKEKKDK